MAKTVFSDGSKVTKTKGTKVTAAHANGWNSPKFDAGTEDGHLDQGWHDPRAYGDGQRTGANVALACVAAKASHGKVRMAGGPYTFASVVDLLGVPIDVMPGCYLIINSGCAPSNLTLYRTPRHQIIQCAVVDSPVVDAEFLRAENFGCKRNVYQDWSNSIQCAINSNPVVKFLRGTYWFNGIKLLSDTKLLGESYLSIGNGSGSTMFRDFGGAGITAIMEPSVEALILGEGNYYNSVEFPYPYGVQIKNIEIFGQEPYASTGDTVLGSSRVSNIPSTTYLTVGGKVYIRAGFSASGPFTILAKGTGYIDVDYEATSTTTGSIIATTYDKIGIALINPQWSYIEKNWVHGWRNGIYIHGATKIYVRDNNIKDCLEEGLYVKGTSDYYNGALGFAQGNNVFIENCSFFYNSFKSQTAWGDDTANFFQVKLWGGTNVTFAPHECGGGRLLEAVAVNALTIHNAYHESWTDTDAVNLNLTKLYSIYLGKAYSSDQQPTSLKPCSNVEIFGGYFANSIGLTAHIGAEHVTGLNIYGGRYRQCAAIIDGVNSENAKNIVLHNIYPADGITSVSINNAGGIKDLSFVVRDGMPSFSGDLRVAYDIHAVGGYKTNISYCKSLAYRSSSYGGSPVPLAGTSNYSSKFFLPSSGSILGVKIISGVSTFIAPIKARVLKNGTALLSTEVTFNSGYSAQIGFPRNCEGFTASGDTVLGSAVISNINNYMQYIHEGSILLVGTGFGTPKYLTVIAINRINKTITVSENATVTATGVSIVQDNLVFDNTDYLNVEVQSPEQPYGDLELQIVVTVEF